MPSQPSFQSIDSNFSGTKPPVTTPNRMSRGSSVRTLVYENRKGDKSVNLNGTSVRLEPSAWQVEQNHCPHGLAPFHSRFPHLKASSLPSSPTRQRWSETANSSLATIQSSLRSILTKQLFPERRVPEALPQWV